MLPTRAPAKAVIQPPPLSKEEMRAFKNATWRERGCTDCPICGDSHGWKHFHVTEFYTGPMTGDNQAGFHGSVGVSVICEECWPKLTPVERLPHVLARVDAWLAQVPSVSKKAVKGERFKPDELIDDPVDVQRREDQLAEIAGIRATLEAKILNGED